MERKSLQGNIETSYAICLALTERHEVEMKVEVEELMMLRFL